MMLTIALGLAALGVLLREIDYCLDATALRPRDGLRTSRVFVAIALLYAALVLEGFR